MEHEAALKQKFASVMPHLNERSRRLFAASEARSLGYGGISKVQRACGLTRNTIAKGIADLNATPLDPARVRKPGGGRRSVERKHPRYEPALEALLEESNRGDPQSPLLWTCKTTRHLARQVSHEIQTKVSHVKIARTLKASNYSLQGNRKTEEGADHPDRDAQFRHINERVKAALGEGEPVISVDTKKKELVGNYANKGRQWRKSGEPRKVNGHDFPGPEVPRALPYGIYDIARNKGHVNLGTDSDTSDFAVASIRGWWENEGRHAYPKARRLVITADAGGSNGYRRRAWKMELQKLSDQTGLPVSVSHFPPGTSKWNKIEHRLFSFISTNWRGEPLCDYETIVKLIGATRTTKGLSVTCQLDHRKYPKGRKVSDEEMRALRLRPDAFHGEWNYTIEPRGGSKQ